MKYYGNIKRSIDVLVSLLMMFFIFPVFILLAIAIKLTSDGPAIFKQVRIGKDKKPFIMYKFRVMVKGAENLKESLKDKNEVKGPVFKIKNDPRLTKIGKFLRDLNLDELPQAYNVFLGDMSIVGPRPALPEEVDNYAKDWYSARFKVTPGMMSLFHVRNTKGLDTEFEEWMKLDKLYIEKKSFWIDLSIFSQVIINIAKQTIKNILKK